MSPARAHQIPGRPEDGDVGGKEKPARAGRPERDRRMELTVRKDLPHIVFRDREERTLTTAQSKTERGKSKRSNSQVIYSLMNED